MKLFKVMETTFDNFDSTVRTYLSKVFNSLGMQYSSSQIFGVIFDGIKGVMQNIMFYIEDALTEQNIYTATRKKSIYSLAKISGFEPNYGNAAGGVLVAKLKVNNNINSGTSKTSNKITVNESINNLYIPNNTQVINKTTGIIYSIMIPTNYYIFSVTNPLIEYQFKIKQGTFTTARYIAKGNVLESIHITTIGLFDRECITVTVDGEEYSEVSCLYDMSNDSKEYMFSIGFDNEFDITFGNGTYGKKLNEGQVIEIKYLRHQGTDGNIYDIENAEFEFYGTLTDTVGNTVNANDFISLTINNTISGGRNSDSIDFIRTMVGSNSRSLIYSSVDNMKLFLKRFSFVGYNNCIASLKYNKIYIICLNNITEQYKNDSDKYFKLTNDDLLLTQNQQQMIIDTLSNSNKTLAGFQIEFIKPIFVKYAIICYVKINSKYNKQIASQIINDTLRNYFINLSYDVKFISKSELLNKIIEADTDKIIESIDLNIISDYNENAYIEGEYKKYYDDIDFDDKTSYVINKYNKNNTPGLDVFGNISLDSIYQLPRLCGGFKYYTDKENSKQDSIIVQPINIYFI